MKRALPFIIAEIGSSPAPAWNFGRWCVSAALAGATHIKAQVFCADHFPEAERESKRPLEFPRVRFAEFVQAAHHFGLKAGASAFDLEAVELVTRHGDFVKLAAREQDNHSLIDACYYRTPKPLIIRSVSTLDVDLYMTEPNFITLYAVQQYPAGLMSSIHKLWKWARLCKHYGIAWGWSSHTISDLDCLLAARLGAVVIEKHLCLADDDLEAGHALNVDQFTRMVKSIKEMKA